MAHRVRVASCVCLCFAGTVLMLPSPAAAAPPSCFAGTLYTPVNTRLVLAGAANPCTDPDGDTYTTRLTALPQHGTLAPDASYYDPARDFHNVDFFTYEAKDSHNEITSATVTIVVDSAPTCTDASATVVAGHALPLGDLPCADVDGSDEFAIIVDDGAHGTVDVDASGNATYLPDPGFVGTDSFPFWAEDDFGAVSPKRRMTITVTSPPAATPVPTPAPTAAPTPPPDRTAPAVTLKNASKKQSLAVTLTTNEPAAATLTATLDSATAHKLKLGRTVGTLKAALKPGTSTLKVKLSAKGAKAIKKVRSVKLTVTAVVADAAGNQTTKTVRVTLRR